jgi:transposase, IS6 family
MRHRVHSSILRSRSARAGRAQRPSATSWDRPDGGLLRWRSRRCRPGGLRRAVRVRRGRSGRAHVEAVGVRWFRFPPEVITVAVGWYLRYGLSYRDVEEMLAEWGVEVDHVTVYRWVQRFTPLSAGPARPVRHASADRQRFVQAWAHPRGRRRSPRIIHGLGPAHSCGCLRNCSRPPRTSPSCMPINRIEADHGWLKARLRPMRGLTRLRSAAVIAANHAFVQNLRHGHSDSATDAPPSLRLATAFTELAQAM